ncbi:hypothetical protein ACFXKW_14965 [Streptomyces sp. NPDC059193]|uniref:hypothetical protein n=1 Tax=Streptomyces sp. NPDC059193 TaxID=3346763 RepID=UPI0036793BC0
MLTTGIAFLLLTPGHSWYALLIVALVALDGRWEWLGIALAGAATYVTSRAFDHAYAVGTTAYAIAAAAVVISWATRRATPTARAEHDLNSPPRSGGWGT